MAQDPTEQRIDPNADAAVGAPIVVGPEGQDAAPPVIEESRVPLRERLAYGVGDIGGNLIFAPISAFILFYFTDTVGIGAAIAGTLILFGRILDGTMDLFVGTLIDKTSTRWGKARPWILLSTPVVVLAFIGLFNVPACLN
jgi:glycoside/pentoside/hexuronide:cation symporter, GPH family